MGWSSRPNVEIVRSYVSSGDLHVIPYLDDVLRKVRRIWMRSFWGHKDFVMSGDVGSQPYEEDAQEEHLLVMGDPLHMRGR